MVSALAIHATRNTGGKVDATGAFVPEAIAFQRFHACHREGFDNTLALPRRRDAVHAILRKHHDLECVALFCHGLRRSMQTGHDLATVGELAAAIAAASGPRVVVALYACSTAAKITVQRGGFADALRDALTARGKTGHVDAHTTAAHTTKNPYLQRFDMGDPVEEIAGDWLVSRTERLWPAWRTRLRATDLRFRFPMMTADAVRAELQQPPSRNRTRAPRVRAS